MVVFEFVYVLALLVWFAGLCKFMLVCFYVFVMFDLLFSFVVFILICSAALGALRCWFNLFGLVVWDVGLIVAFAWFRSVGFIGFGLIGWLFVLYDYSGGSICLMCLSGCLGLCCLVSNFDCWFGRFGRSGVDGFV